MERQEVTGFVGLGIMGGAMAERLLAAGFALHVHARRPEQTAPLLDRGAVLAGDIPALARRSARILTIVGGPADVEALYLGPDGLIAHARPGTVLVDMTTSSPALARRIADAAAARGLRALDAPVTGGAPGAAAGTLTFMAGGEAATLADVRPLLEAMGSRVFHMGPAGTGQATKASNQIAVAGILMGLAEALHFAEGSGIAATAALEVLATGTAGGPLMQRLGPKMIGKGGAATFHVAHFIKDLGIALDEAGTAAPLPATALCRNLYAAVAARNGGRRGIEALIDAYRDSDRRPPA